MSLPPIRIELIEVAVPMRVRHPAADVAARRLILVAWRAGSFTGWGECAPVRGYSPEDLDSCWEALTRYARLGEASVTGTAHIPLPATAAAALDQARTDHAAHQALTPLWRHVGGSHPRVGAGVVVAAATAAEEAAAALATGYRHVKVKIGPADLEALGEVRRRFPDLSLAADANGTLDPAGHAALAELDSLGLAYLEQPFPAGAVDAHVAAAETMTTPLVLDESTETDGWLDPVLGAAPRLGVTVKPGRVRWTQVRRGWVARLRAAGVPVRVGGMLESGIGRAHAFATGSLLGDLPGDLSPPDGYLEHGLVDPPWRLTDGGIALPDAPGVGVAVDGDAVAEYAVRRAHFP